MIDHQVSSVFAGKDAPLSSAREKKRACCAWGHGNGNSTKASSKRVGRTPYSSNSRLLTPHVSRCWVIFIFSPPGILVVFDKKRSWKKLRSIVHSIPIVPGVGARDAPPVAKNAATSGLVDTSSRGLNTRL